MLRRIEKLCKLRTNSQALACLITALATTVATIGHTQPPVTVPEAAENEFHFVVLGDAQFDDPPAFNRIIDQTVLLDPAFVIQVGDLIEGYQSDLGNIDAGKFVGCGICERHELNSAD